MSEKFVGKWAYVDGENFDAYMKEVGVGFVLRKMACALKPTLTIEIDGDHWKITSESTFKTIILDFKLNEEFDEITGDGRKMKSTMTFEDGKLIQIEKAISPGDKDSRIERYIDETGKLIIVMRSGDVAAKRVYEKM
ncbi:hypothetical protein AB6A40_003115 [Gnathostoma spinigerum]|uniref:Lipocalin/cytosolic fatty-acid binding domain-containing protein n=1 Tax=Gnathostoma spinigerum TaxID=75299 RepID=A0ABD6EG86_9BILA